MIKKKLMILASLFFLVLTGCNGAGGPSSSAPEGELSINTSFDSVDTSSEDIIISNDSPTSEMTSSPGSSENDGGSTSTPTTTANPADRVFFHFKEGDFDFETHALWVWGSDRSGIMFDCNGEDEFGPYLEIKPKEEIGELYVKDCIYILVRTRMSWAYQTTDTQIKYKDHIPQLIDGEYVLHVYFLLSENKQDLMVFDTLEETMRDKVMYAYLDEKLKKIVINADGAIKTVKLYKLPTSYFLDELKGKKVKYEDHLVYENLECGDKEKAEIILDHAFELNSCYKVGCTFVSDDSYISYYNVVLDKAFNSPLFDNYVYDGDDLGATVNKNADGKVQSITFKLWAPTAYYVRVNVYNYGFDSLQADNPTFDEIIKYDTPSQTMSLKIDKTGVYSCTMYGDHSGKYYTYTVINSLGTSEIPDPYAESSGINSKRSMIVNWDSEQVKVDEFDALPLKWDGDERLDIKSKLDLTIYETHIRDLTMDDSWSSNPEDDPLRGTFRGFIKRGTTYQEGGVTVKTGFDHLEELGVNAIQLIPVFDQDNVERHDLTSFNWGYNPQLYNVVEGSYSSDPFDGYSRVREFRELVAAFANNANNTRIIMDVVYNHISSPTTNALNISCPKYYFRITDDGAYREGSGCGNEIRTEAPMMRRFIINSLKFWATNYKIKGFRFDLMGLIDCETLKQAKEELYEIDPDIILYGEGWTGDGSYNIDNGVTSSAYSMLYESDNSKGMVGAFNDCGRDAIRGGNGSWGELYTKPTHGFIAQGAEHFDAGKARNVGEMMKGINPNAGANPEQTINYASCHDNYTLFDQLNWTLSEDGGTTEPDIEVVARASVAVNGMVLMSNGVSFIHGGEEIFRSKILTDEDPDDSGHETTMYGKRISHNSYMYSDECNSYKYERKVQLLEYFEMYAALIDLRKELQAALYPKNTAESYDLVNTWDVDDKDTAIATYRKGVDGENYYILFNGRSENAHIDSTEHRDVLFNNGGNVTYSDGYVLPTKYQLVVMKGEK